jgi:ATP phosphoribosyltransferase regulatory subunit
MSAGAIRALLEGRGARFIDPPVLQPGALYLELVGEEIRRRVFMIQSEDGAELCLRPDMTAPVCRMALAEGLVPSVLAYEGLVFRRQGAASAKETEFAQIGAEWCGLPQDAAEIDAAVLSAALAACAAFGVQPRLRLGDASLFVATAAAFGWPAEWVERLARGFQRPGGIARVFAEAAGAAALPAPALALEVADMPAAAAQARVAAALAQAGVVPVGARPIAEIAARLQAQARDAAAARPPPEALAALKAALAIEAEPEAALDALSAVIARAPAPALAEAALTQARRRMALARADLPQDRAFSLGFGRGLAYYDGFLFELEAPSLGERASLGGGGRYNGLLAALAGDPHAAPAQCAMTAAGFAVRPARLMMAGAGR